MRGIQRKKLTTENPAIAREWDYEKNGNLRPEDFTGASNKRVWWKCNLGHSWRASINHRSNGTECPYCKGNKVWAGFNDLLTTHPQVAAQWDCVKNGELNPKQVSAGSNKKAWWICKGGHSWQAVISSRAKGCDCPYCVNLKVLRGFNDLLSNDPILCLEWDHEKNAPLKPDEVTMDSNKKVWWRCDKGHSWETCISVRRKGCVCPYCIGKLVIPGETDLKTTRPDIAAEWDHDKNGDLKPEMFTTYSNKRAWWKCCNGHSWRTAISHRSAKQGCPYCKGRKVWAGFNDISTTHPGLAAEWNYVKNKRLIPEQVSSGSNKKVWWKCEDGHSWQADVASRIRGSGCPYCVGKKVLKGFNDLSSKDPKLSLQWDYEKNAPLKPDEITTESNKRVWWICNRGHSWRTAVYARRKGDTCPYCIGKLAIPGETDLKTVCPNIASEWDHERNGSLTPETVTPQSSKKVWWKCVKRGHSYRATVSNRYNGRGCPYCNGKTPMRTRLVM